MPSTNWRSRKPAGRWSLRRARRLRMVIQLALASAFLLLVLPALIVYKPPQALMRYIASRSPDVLFHVPTTEKIVALTIDDVPSPYTAEILSTLKEYGATATFFVIGGQVTSHEHETMLGTIVQQGSELGNHAMHDEPSISLSSEVLTEQISQVDHILDQAYQRAGRERGTRMFRPGSGYWSQRLVDLAAKSGYRTILGDIFPFDPYVSFWRINSWHILSSLSPGGIIVCHDRRSWTVPMLKRVLPEMKKRGYRVVSVSQLLAMTRGGTGGEVGVRK